jgi:hypothetical protein
MDNTAIMYTGDQGFFLGEHDMQDKRWAYEPCYRMPLIVRYPKTIAAGSRSDALVENVDYPVTLLDYAGAGRPAYMQGRSFRKILDRGGEPESWKKGGLLPILDAHGPPRRPRPHCHADQALQADSVLRLCRRQRFGNPATCEKYTPPWQRATKLDPSER